ncbi:PrgI family protein [Nocardia sp. CA2R105]|uniref:PrgI family protein n=1 Tax=Nocardia coffeae TaxID=2873381 RepID=UPI001CA7ADF8|nr:PrgI family protein [Nocardia coffeae]MBY8855367.1 PrgI family protein [Nocardia coffeae]
MNAYRIPSDVERPDRILGPLTARQLALLSATGLVLLLIWAITRALVPITVFAGLAAPIAAVATAIALTTRDGLSGDQLLMAGLRHHRRARHLIAMRPGGDTEGGAVPRWVTGRARGPRPPIAQPITPGTAGLPQAVTAGSGAGGGVGVVDLGEEGIAVIAAATTINLALRTPAEQAGLVGALAGYLQSLSGNGVQILLRSVRLDVTGHITDLHTAAHDMPPALAEYALDHSRYLSELAADDTTGQRQVLLVWREPLDPATRLADSLVGGLTARGRRERRISVQARHAAESRLLARLSDATDLLVPLGVGVRALDDSQARAILTSCTNPANLVPYGAAGAASPTEIITTEDSPYTGTQFDPLDTDDEQDDVGHGAQGLGPRARRGRTPRRGGGVEFAPESLTIGARHLQVGSDFVATIAVTGYPREVTPGWLSPLAAFGGRVDIALHIEPIDPHLAAMRLRRQLARLESSMASAAVNNRVGDPAVEVAAEDAAALSAQLARGESRLFRAGLYLTVHATSEDELTAQVTALRTLAASLLIDTCPLTYRAVEGWTATLPLGLDPVRLHRTFDSHALAAAVPFASAQLPPTDPVSVTPAGVLYGRDGAAGLLFHDRFGPAMHNHNEVILGRSGSGKSYLAKTSILRSLYRGIETIVIDPEDEYAALCEALGGTHIRLGAPGVCLNPFDLDIHVGPSGHRTATADALLRRKLHLHTVIAVLLGEQTPAQRAALDTAVTATYLAAGITHDPATWVRAAPTLSMLRDQLAATGSPVTADLAAGLAPYVGQGAFAGLLDGASTHHPAGALTVYSLRELPEELKTIGTLLALDATWRRVSDPSLRRPRAVVVDEAWLLMRQPAGASFLARLAKSARKYFVGLTVATQDAADVLATDLGKAIVANSATQVLLRQAPQSIDQIGDAFSLSDGERRFLLSADRGQGLLATGAHQRTVFGTVASLAEHQLATTSPEYDLPDTDEQAGYLDLDLDAEDTRIDLDLSSRPFGTDDPVRLGAQVLFGAGNEWDSARFTEQETQ